MRELVQQMGVAYESARTLLDDPSSSITDIDRTVARTLRSTSFPIESLGQPQPGTGGYGYQVWIFPGERRIFALRGVRGQAIFVDPANRLVMVHTAVRKQARDPGVRESNALWRSIVRELGY